MKRNVMATMLLTVVIFMMTHCSKDMSPLTAPSNGAPDSLHIKKPNIYIYPTRKMELSIKISFPQGGRITTSIPPYENGWTVTVDTTGLINDAYRYLFYECKVPHQFQKDEGWLVPAPEIESFFNENRQKFGFTVTEIADLIDYWIPQLNKYPYYLIFPQNTEIVNQTVQLWFSEPPTSMHRLYFLFQGVNRPEGYKLSPPAMAGFTQDGFTVVEWGGMIAE